jgi:hypothetical protein
MITHQKSNNKYYGVSVLFPAFNDEGSIARLIHEALKVASRITSDYEVIVVNDGRDCGSFIIRTTVATGGRCGADSRALQKI